MDYEFRYTSPDGTSWESYRQYVLVGVMGLCGCYDEQLAEDIIATIKAFGQAPVGAVYYSHMPIEGPDKYRELILHRLDSVGLIEHGTSIRGSWLTDRGREIANQLEQS